MSDRHRHRLFETMHKPKVGDTVMEITSCGIKGRRHGIGKLISKTPLTGCLAGSFTYVIRTPEGENVQWTNASFITIPNGTFDWYPETPSVKTVPA